MGRNLGLFCPADLQLFLTGGIINRVVTTQSRGILNFWEEILMERKKGWLTSGAFAALCGTTKETLRHYKDVGLLPPKYQGDNGYFYYDVEQFYDFYAISIFRQTGTPLEGIRSCLQRQDTSETMELLREQKSRLAVEQKKLEHMDFVLSSALRNLELGSVPDMVPETAWFEREHLLAIPAGEDRKSVV